MAEETKLNQDDWADKIGTHSARKGSCGRTVSPPMASICLRAGIIDKCPVSLVLIQINIVRRFCKL